MKTLEELSIELDQREVILSKAIMFGKDAFYLNFPDTKEERTVTANYEFIHKVRVSYWIIAILEMNKIYGKKNDAFTMKKLLNKLIQNHKNSEWKDSLEKQTITGWIDRLESSNLQNSIRKIQGLRDQFYAHTDRNAGNIYDLALEKAEFQTLATFATEVITTTLRNVLGVDLIIERPGDGRADEILNELVELNRLITDDFIRSSKK